jgi:hypothetical protein
MRSVRLPAAILLGVDPLLGFGFDAGKVATLRLDVGADL